MKALLSTAMVLALATISLPARGETVAVLVVSSQDLTEGQQQSVVEASEGALRALSSLTLEAQGRKAILSGPKKRCGTDLDCLVGLAEATGAHHGLLLSLALQEGQLVANGFWVDVARRKVVYRQVPPTSASQTDEAAQALVEAVLPGFARKGFGGVVIEAPAGSVVKANGRKVAMTPLELPLPLSEGTHEVDVVLPTGEAALQRTEILEGRRVSLRAEAGAMPSNANPLVRSHALETTAYSLWAAGAVAIAGSFVAGGLAKQATVDLRSCSGGDRSCDTFANAQTRIHRSQTLATTGNWLMGTGLVLSATGAGLFTFDLLQRSAK